MPVSEARKRANAKYNLKAYDRVELKVKKGEKEKIRLFAEANGESLNSFINRAIKEAMGAPKKEPESVLKQSRRREISVELL